MSETLKICKKDPSHIWMADLPYCPYCNLTAEARIHGLRKAERQEREMKELGITKDKRRIKYGS